MNKPKLSDQFSRHDTSNKKGGTSWILICLCLFAALALGYAYLFFSDDRSNIKDLIKIFENQKSVVDSTPAPKPLHKKWITIHPAEIKPRILQKEPKEKIYSWIDENEIKQFSNVQPDTDLLTKDLKVVEGIANRENSVIIQNNQILIPVTLAYNKRKNSTYLLLDTGATVTSIHDDFAKIFEPIRYKKSITTVADGRRISTKITIFDYIRVGPYTYKNIRVDIIPYEKKSNVSKGLLGMNFLKHFKYQIDHKRKVIQWL